jgi:hypothetical protein
MRVLQRHPKARLNFHWSGTLLTAMRWWHPEMIVALGDRLLRGEWEILASTHAQSVPYTGPPVLNRLALGVHRSLLHAAFPEVVPRGYWIAERSWRPSLAAEITAAGLEYTLVEDRTLAAAGCTDLLRPRRLTAKGGRDLTIISDCEAFKHLFNFAIWTGDFDPMFAHLRKVRDEESARPMPPLVTWAEDAEAVGLWAVERGCPPQITWENLDRLLTAIEAEPGVQLTCLGEFVDRFADKIPRERRRIADGQATWMRASLADAHLPYHEEGYRDWFDFNRRAPKIRWLRPQLARAARAVFAFEPRTEAQHRLALHAAFALAANTYEFGCIGIGGKRGELWDRHRIAALPLAIASGAAPEESKVVDLNRDGVKEAVLVSPNLISLWSRRTGALLHLFDRETGDELVGNELAAEHLRGEGHNEEHISEWKAPQRVWSAFRSERQKLEDFEGLWDSVPPEQAWMRWILDWKALGDAVREVRQVRLPDDGTEEGMWRFEREPRDTAGFLWPPPVRPRALVERVVIDGREVLDVAKNSRARGGSARLREIDGALQICLVRGPVTLLKRVRQRGMEISVDYEFHATRRGSRDVEFTITSEWVPSYLTTLLFGRGSVEPTAHGARNLMTGAEVEFIIDEYDEQLAAAGALEVTPSLLGIVNRRTMRFILNSGERLLMKTNLRVVRGEQFAHLDEIAQRWRDLCGLPE